MVRHALTGPVTAYIAAEFRAQRGRLAWTFDDLERHAELGRATIHRALKGDAGLTVEAFVQIARALSLDPVRLLREASAAASVLHVVPDAADHPDRDAGPEGGGL